MIGSLKDKGWEIPPEYEEVNEEELKDFLDRGLSMDIVPPRPKLNFTAIQSLEDELYYSKSTDMVSFQGNDHRQQLAIII